MGNERIYQAAQSWGTPSPDTTGHRLRIQRFVFNQQKVIVFSIVVAGQATRGSLAIMDGA